MTKVLLLRTCDEDLKARGGFQWPESGPVECPDWDPEPRCGGGLHGLLWGEGDRSLLNWASDAKWLVFEALEEETVNLKGKVKCKRGEVLYCGDRKGATEFLAARAPGKKIVGGTATAGDYGTATAGDYGTATAGDEGTATAGDDGTLALRWWDGNRYRIAVFYVGEDGIEPNVAYRCAGGKAVRVSK